MRKSVCVCVWNGYRCVKEKECVCVSVCVCEREREREREECKWVFGEMTTHVLINRLSIFPDVLSCTERNKVLEFKKHCKEMCF